MSQLTKSNNIVALIPARGGSKGIPRKNIRNFVGYPLIAYSIAAGLNSKLVTRVIVSTDDEEIAELVLETAGEVYGSTGVARLEPAMEAFESEFLRYTEFVGNLAEEGFEHIVTMPGVITASNGEEEDLNRVTWEIESSRIQYLGADLWVESRVPNRLAVWITILLAIGVLTIAIVTIVRRT